MSDIDILRRLADLEKRVKALEALESGGVVTAWTPLLTGSGGGGNYTTLVAVGEYILDNGRVTVWGRYTVNTFTAAPSGTLRMTGLPFTARATTNAFYALALGYTNPALNTAVRALIPAGQNYIDFYDVNGATVAASLMSAASYIIVGGSYAL